MNPLALHSFCIIVARKGFSDNAQEAAYSAMRANGKMILMLDMNDLEELRNRTTIPEGPDMFIREKITEHLLQVGR